MTSRFDPPPSQAMRVHDTLTAAGHAAWFVGGCVRDRLLGRPVSDWDLATDAHPDRVLALFDHAIPTGLEHGTVTVVVEAVPVEVTTFRIEEGYSDGRRPDTVRFTGDLETDLARRDFTLNAIAWDPATDRIVDPFGGRADLAVRCLRAVGEATRRFAEDGLRAMRAVRFASTLGLSVHPDTWAAIPQTLDIFGRVAVERVRVELSKIISGPRPGWGMELLDGSGLLGVFLPEHAARSAADKDRHWRAIDSLRPALRLAALEWPVTAAKAEATLARLRFSNADRRLAVAMIRHRGVDPTGLVDGMALRRFVAEVGPGEIDGLIELQRAFAIAPAAAEAWAALPARLEASGALEGPHAVRDLPISGRDVMNHLGIPPSRRVGRILEAALARVWRQPSLDDREALLDRLPEIAAEVDV